MWHDLKLGPDQAHQVQLEQTNKQIQQVLTRQTLGPIWSSPSVTRPKLGPDEAHQVQLLTNKQYDRAFTMTVV